MHDCSPRPLIRENRRRYRVDRRVRMRGASRRGRHPPALVLIPIAAKALTIPIIASGGIADGRGMAAALVLGAEGVNMGTRFICTKEAPVHENIKKGIVGSSERDTRLIFRTLHNTARVLRNAVSEEVVAMEHRPSGCTFAEIKHLVVGTRGKAAWESGDLNGGILTAGMAIGLIDDVPTCKELIERIVRDCSLRLHHAAACLDSDL
jgi:NADH:quinone reductase (non-electrogenic)